MNLLLLAVPFITSVIMFGVKWLAGLNATDNGAQPRPFLRTMLVVVSLGGVIATSTLNGTPVDPNVVSQDLIAILETGVLAFFAHAFYNSVFRR